MILLLLQMSLLLLLHLLQVVISRVVVVQGVGLDLSLDLGPGLDLVRLQGLEIKDNEEPGKHVKEPNKPPVNGPQKNRVPGITNKCTKEA